MTTSAFAQTADGLVTLSGINVPPAQTWNYLHINETSLAVPQLPEDLGGVRPDPGAFADIETSAGQDATAWLDAAADVCAWLPDATGVARIEVGGPVTATDVTVPDGGELTLYVTATPGGGESLPEDADEGVAHAAEGALEGVVSGHALRIRAGHGSRVTLVGVYAMGALPYLESVGIALEEDASLEVRQYVLGGTKTVMGMAIDQRGPRSSVDLSCRYLVRQGEQLDLNYVDRMRGASTECALAFSGVLGQGASKTLCDTIDLVHGAKGAEGLENETVLIAGDDVVNKSLPTILCDEDDVAGNHGATIGSVSPEQLAFLSARGLSAQEATQLFVRAVVDDAAAHADAAGRAAVMAFAQDALGQEVAEELAQAHGDVR